MMGNKSYRIGAGLAGEEGKSLVEIAIVVMIIAVVTAIALPAVGNSIRSYNLRSAATRIAERLAGARTLAMAKNKNVTAAFATGGGGNVTPPSGIIVSFSAGGTTLANGKGVTYTSRGELPIGASQADIRLSNSSSILTVSINLRGQVWVH
jgi:Tfp pilus assembly protein FimT